jgi:putative oxygen-independent coproporphyrinogen III oxidase
MPPKGHFDMNRQEFPADSWLTMIGQQLALEEQPSTSSVRKRPRGVYIHVPYCVTRCGYCDFNTYTPREVDVATRDYANAAIREIEVAGSLWNPAEVDTVFFGGGTPTMLESDDLIRILKAVRDAFGLARNAEVTVEANPDSVDEEKLVRLLAGGVNRISFGIQSLSPKVLAVLDRTHTPGRAISAIADAHSAGFQNVSADIIYATPGETDDDLRRTLDGVLDSGINHLSAYSLIVEPGTRLAAQVNRKEIAEVDDDVAASRYAIVDAYAHAQGLSWYEVSNWSKPGAECRHNLGYWQGGEWWAIGPGAHGYSGRVRWWNVKHPAAYLDRIAETGTSVGGFEEIDDEAQRLERLMLEMRVRDGVRISRLSDSAVAALPKLVSDGWIVQHRDRIVLTDSGRLFADAVIRAIT